MLSYLYPVSSNPTCCLLIASLITLASVSALEIQIQYKLIYWGLLVVVVVGGSLSEHSGDWVHLVQQTVPHVSLEWRWTQWRWVSSLLFSCWSYFSLMLRIQLMLLRVRYEFSGDAHPGGHRTQKYSFAYSHVLTHTHIFLHSASVLNANDRTNNTVNAS